jgi:hypothetical protein
MSYKSDINESFLKDFKQIEQILNILENKIASIKQFTKEAEEIINQGLLSSQSLTAKEKQNGEKKYINEDNLKKQ